MKKILHIARSMAFGAVLFSIAACGSADTDAPPAAENQTYYGSVIELDGALDASPETGVDYQTKDIHHLLRPATRTWRGNTSSS